MSTFDKREASFESKFAHDEEIQFKILARASKMLGLWAAEKLGKSGPAADDYAHGLVIDEVAAGFGVTKKINTDFAEAGVGQSEHQVARHFEEFRAQATKDVMRR